MIRYALRCSGGHDFEGWFRNSDTFDSQRAADEIACPTCGETEVEKSLMAPALSKGGAAPAAEAPAAPASDEAKPASGQHALAADPKAKALMDAIRELRRHVTDNADYVGNRFADEARRIHNEETERRDIYGEATADETRSLLEDGIEVLPLPALPEEKN